ncbi:MAG: N-acetyl-alpha-D-glucosaminyl-diphospho-ditrans, octacis-undecaprenol 4-epimerase [Patescibacteria group bacterium]|nr:MAG: N-acetyl-alpha-D-glucosaminyl-diphospho-ditrans, octacis-undecaprenol 4-epimerase [Patescibacteria group bacterium]
MKEKILVTGAAGFIGSHLVEYLLEKKIPISSLRLFIKTGESLENLPKRNFDIIVGDIRNKKDVAKAMETVTTVYHLAARIDFDGKTYAEYEDVNVQGTKNLLTQAVKNKNFKKFINYSSIGVHGLPAGIGDIVNWDETHEPSYTNFYGRSKWEAEKAVRAAHKKYGLAYAIIRPASVYGPREKGPTLALYKAVKSGQFLMIGNGSNKMHYVFVRDLVVATYLAGASKRSSGEYIIAGPNPTQFKDVVKYVAQSIGKPVPKLCISKPLALCIAYIFQILTRATGKTLPLFPSRVKTMTTTYYYNISKAKKELEYKPKVSFKEGSKIVGEWYIENGFL